MFYKLALNVGYREKKYANKCLAAIINLTSTFEVAGEYRRVANLHIYK